jgi:hypothetical protein
MFLILTVGLIVGSIGTAIAAWRWASKRRGELADERVKALAEGYKKTER